MTDSDEPRWVFIFNSLWRPIFAYELILECAAMAVLAVHEIWTGDAAAISAMMGFQNFLTWYYGMRFAVLGVAVGARSVEKVTAIGVGAPGKSETTSSSKSETMTSSKE